MKDQIGYFENLTFDEPVLKNFYIKRRILITDFKYHHIIYTYALPFSETVLSVLYLMSFLSANKKTGQGSLPKSGNLVKQIFDKHWSNNYVTNWIVKKMLKKKGNMKK